MKSLRILTWPVHGSYLYYLTQVRHNFYLPMRPGHQGVKAGSYSWDDNVFDVPSEEVRDLEFDCILFQSRQNYLEDQYEILSEAQRRLPRIYLEHDPPREHPTDTRHVVDDPTILLVHVTHFNDLMWDSGRTPTRVIEHGVLVPDEVHYTGELRRGVVVINNLKSRGRRLGADVFERARSEVPLDLFGINAEEMGGVASLSHHDLLVREAHYRFFFNPIRYTSLGLAVCEAMTLGLPILGLATTEMGTTIKNGVSGFVTTDVRVLITYALSLLDDPSEARHLGEGARRAALERFGIERFRRDWEETLALVT
jgi:hypothetical protein